MAFDPLEALDQKEKAGDVVRENTQRDLGAAVFEEMKGAFVPGQRDQSPDSAAAFLDLSTDALFDSVDDLPSQNYLRESAASAELSTAADRGAPEAPVEAKIEHREVPLPVLEGEVAGPAIILDVEGTGPAIVFDVEGSGPAVVFDIEGSGPAIVLDVEGSGPAVVFDVVDNKPVVGFEGPRDLKPVVDFEEPKDLEVVVDYEEPQELNVVVDVEEPRDLKPVVRFEGPRIPAVRFEEAAVPVVAIEPKDAD